MPKRRRKYPPYERLVRADGAVHLLTPPDREPLARVDIWDLGRFYGRLGVREGDFQRWQEKYGLGKGEGPEGELFVPGFPIFSKAAWMGIASVGLSGSQIEQLREECERAVPLAGELPEAEGFRAIRDLAVHASGHERAEVWFGYGEARRGDT